MGAPSYDLARAGRRCHAISTRKTKSLARDSRNTVVLEARGMSYPPRETGRMPRVCAADKNATVKQLTYGS